ncbi:unnamed protein product [Brugia pahangi]|uniref:Uncharacterized protein n=1 Tax=Brugia pahangi TaxID=6280 RepID=A0A0N4TLJ5_BRUPA|nr:unnamed protein product [Brugia pahangi]
MEKFCTFRFIHSHNTSISCNQNQNLSEEKGNSKNDKTELKKTLLILKRKFDYDIREKNQSGLNQNQTSTKPFHKCPRREVTSSNVQQYSGYTEQKLLVSLNKFLEKYFYFPVIHFCFNISCYY